ncbi:MAG: hypothetical protein FWE24_11620 [Defluviitaleaceae bacterium]|nr:hypothetical protein [Defluviitaleaceae bacterium]
MNLKTIFFLFSAILIISFASMSTFGLSHHESWSNTLEKTEKVANNLMEIEGIEAVSVVIVDNSAIIGLGVDKNLGEAAITALKTQAERKTLAIPSIDHAAITAAPHLVKQIKENADFTTGK